MKQYILFADFEQEVKERRVADMPNVFVKSDGKLNKHTQAYFGLFRHLFDTAQLSAAGLDDERCVKYAFEIDSVAKTAVAEYSINPAEIENAISMKLLPMLFDDLGIDNAERFIQEVLQITRLGLSRGE
ncbi:MAG: type I restriction enzyme R subunit [Arenicella sp.]